MTPNYTRTLVLAGALLAAVTAAQATWSTDEGPEAAAVRTTIEGAYFNGAFNAQDTTAMARGFHEDFAIFSPKGEELSRYEIETWIEGIKTRRAKSDFDPASTAIDCSIVLLDVTGGAAGAKVEMRRDGKLVYTDYLSLLKFDSGWKIVAKVYHRH